MKLITKMLRYVLAAVMILSLTACANAGTSSNPATGEPAVSAVMSPSASSAPVPSPELSASPAPEIPKDLTMDDINAYLDEQISGMKFEILGTTDVSADIILVEYFVETVTNRFVLCNLKTGTIEQLPVQDVVLKKAVNEDYFVFEVRGEYTDSAFRFFPCIERCFRVSGSNEGHFVTTTESESFDLSRSVEAGCKNGSILDTLNVTFDGFEVLFKPVQTQEGRGNFYADATSIPETTTSYNAAANQFTVQLATGVLGDGIKTDIKIKTADNLYMTSYEIVQKNGMTFITANLNDFAKRYMIEEKIGPNAYIEGVDGSFPYLVVTFAPEPDFPMDY